MHQRQVLIDHSRKERTSSPALSCLTPSSAYSDKKRSRRLKFISNWCMHIQSETELHMVVPIFHHAIHINGVLQNLKIEPNPTMTQLWKIVPLQLAHTLSNIYPPVPSYLTNQINTGLRHSWFIHWISTNLSIQWNQSKYFIIFKNKWSSSKFS